VQTSREPFVLAALVPSIFQFPEFSGQLIMLAALPGAHCAVLNNLVVFNCESISTLKDESMATCLQARPLSCHAKDNIEMDCDLFTSIYHRCISSLHVYALFPPV
jgi:hypothetical protein